MTVALSAIACGECGAPMRLRESRFGKFWGCSRYPDCSGKHGAHADGTPLGIPANKATREARTRAHASFDRLWKSGLLSRPRAYAWLRRVMGLSEEEGHIGRFTIAQCELLAAAVEGVLGDGSPDEDERDPMLDAFEIFQE